MSSPGTAAEDYVKSIYSLTEWQPGRLSSMRLASKLGHAPSTVTEMVRKLVDAGLVDHEPYGAIELTADGLRLALRQVRRHRIVETWLVAHHGFAWDEVHDEAEVLEHAMSDRLIESIAAALGNPRRDPHGDPIPSADGEVTIPRGIRLDEAPDGLVGAVVRIDDEHPEVLRTIADAGIDLDVEVSVSVVDGTRRVTVAGATLIVDDLVAEAIWVGRDAN